MLSQHEFTFFPSVNLSEKNSHSTCKQKVLKELAFGNLFNPPRITKIALSNLSELVIYEQFFFPLNRRIRKKTETIRSIRKISFVTIIQLNIHFVRYFSFVLVFCQLPLCIIFPFLLHFCIYLASSFLIARTIRIYGKCMIYCNS